MQIRWIASSSATAFYLAELLLNRPWLGLKMPPEAPLASVCPPAESLWRFLDSWQREPIWRHLVALSAEVESDVELAQLACRKAVGREAAAGVQFAKLAAAIGEMKRAVRQAVPDIAQQLPLRIRPLRQQWEAIGPGLLHHAGKLVEPGAIAEGATIVAVQPLLGGGGYAMLDYNQVQVEAVLVDGEPALPEVLRLGWLLLQLNVDLPRFSEKIDRRRQQAVAALGWLPATLEAGSRVDLCSPPAPGLLRQAVRHWLPAAAPALKGTPDQIADVVDDWWHTALEASASWTLALQALDRMMEGNF